MTTHPNIKPRDLNSEENKSKYAAAKTPRKELSEVINTNGNMPIMEREFVCQFNGC